MDNLGAHKVAGVREAIEVRGAHLLYLPPNSPDLTRSSRSSPSSRPCCEPPPSAPSRPSGTPSAVSALHAFTPAERANYLAHAGYVPSHRKRF